MPPADVQHALERFRVVAGSGVHSSDAMPTYPRRLALMIRKHLLQEIHRDVFPVLLHQVRHSLVPREGIGQGPRLEMFELLGEIVVGVDYRIWMLPGV